VTNNDERAIIRRGEAARRKGKRTSDEGRFDGEEISEDPFSKAMHLRGNPLCRSLTSPTSSPFPRSSNSSVCLRQRAHGSVRDTRSRCTRAPLLTEGLLKREIFEVANLFPRLILQRRTSRLGWHAVVHQNDQVLLCGCVPILQLSLVTLSSAFPFLLFSFFFFDQGTIPALLGKDNTLWAI